MINRILIAIAFLLSFTNAQAANLTYNLKPQKVADGVYAFIGSMDLFDRNNGGNIVNTGFIVGKTGVIVIDTGPSAKYGHEMREAIRTITPKPVSHVILTHHHPDHFLGTQAFQGAKVMALSETMEALKVEGEGLLENMFQMVGDWMIDTVVVHPSEAISVSKADFAGRKLKFIPFYGHTAGDLVILDEKTGAMFTGDLVFHNRTATTPHANIEDWLISLETLQNTPFTKIVPGHGPMELVGRSIRQTIDYLTWLKHTLEKAAANGMEMTEVMQIEKPERFKNLSVDKVEFHRSVAHLWPEIVAQTLPKLN